jgi:predicted porin
MKKTLIASAIAATLSVNAFADEAADLASKINAMPTVYGSIELVHVSTDNDVVTDHEFADNGSTIGIMHEHAVSEGVTAFAKAEFEFGADDKNTSNGIDTLDEAYIGLRGDFGSVQVGSDETVYDWIDVLDTSEAVGIGAINEQNEGDNLQYVSPEIAEGLTLGLTAPIDSDTNFGGALAAKYAVDNLEVALGYAMGREEGGVDAEDIIGLGVTFSMDALTLLAQYETQKDTADLYGVMGMYTMGQNVFALGYQMISPDFAGSEDQSDIYVQALHNLSDNAYIYLEYLMQTDVAGVADADLDTLAVGATYKF